MKLMQLTATAKPHDHDDPHMVELNARLSDGATIVQVLGFAADDFDKVVYVLDIENEVPSG